jgi:hypothetical protein
MTTHTSRTLEYLRNDGYICDVVEKWIRNPKHPAGGFRRDLFGFADILAFKPESAWVLLVQSCGSSYSEHKKKLYASPLAAEWVRRHELMLIGWRKLKKKRGGKQMVWTPRVQSWCNYDHWPPVE